MVLKGKAVLKGNRRSIELYQAMSHTYTELGSGGGLMSVTHIHERVKRAADTGVVWIGSLFVLLEDIESRSKTF